MGQAFSDNIMMSLVHRIVGMNQAALTASAIGLFFTEYCIAAVGQA
jgi:hypothetical protein